MKRYRLAGAFLACAAVAAALALAVGAFGDGSAQAARTDNSADVVGTLTIEGLQGATSLKLRSYSWGVKNPMTIGSPGGGSGAGKATFSDVVVERSLDAVTPKLVTALVTGAHFPSATMVVKTGRGTMQYTFTVVFVTSVQHSVDDGEPTESLSLTYGAVRVESAQ